MGPIKTVSLLLILGFLTSCQLPYLVRNGVGQLSLLNARVDIDQVLNDPKVSDTEKRKLLLAKQVKEFTVQTLHLKQNKNYTTYVKLDRPSLSYVVNAAEKWQLKTYTWWFPVVGTVPYKGFFDQTLAKEEEASLQKQDLDTYVRGVSAYSTLGWFSDPIYSSMTATADHDFVNTIIHESVHATLFIKNSAEFNERMAVFIGNKGTELFYLNREGKDSSTLKEIQNELADEKTFSQFITAEIARLSLWYRQNTDRTEELRAARLNEITEKFKQDIQPKLRSTNYQRFADSKLNNAKLSLYRTYMQDLADFEELFQLSHENFEVFLQHCQSLESSDSPEKGLKALVTKLRG